MVMYRSLPLTDVVVGTGKIPAASAEGRVRRDISSVAASPRDQKIPTDGEGPVIKDANERVDRPADTADAAVVDPVLPGAWKGRRR